jgi:aminopeptidase N
MNFKLFTFAFLLFTFYFSTFAQTSDKFNRIRTYDVQHYIIRVNFEHEKRKVIGETTIQLKPLIDNFTLLELDATKMQFESVKIDSNGKDLQYQQIGEKIQITLDKPYAKNDLISVSLKYTSITCTDLKKINSCKGVYFTKQTGTQNQQIWTQGEPEEAHYWFPSYDFPDDKATVEKFITVKSDQTAIGNGELLEIIENPDKTKTFHYKTNFPFSTYLVSFVVGKFVKIEDKYRDIPLGFYVYKGKEQISKKAFQNTIAMFNVFEDSLKIKYPFNKYDQTIVSDFTAGGMENITATTLDDASILQGNVFGNEDLIAHEISHSWFGNLVTCKNWAELWLNEGFATFMEAVYREKGFGKASYIEKIKEDTNAYFIEEYFKKNKRGLYNQLAKPDDSIFDAITYQKGGVVIHQLREQVGDELFWNAVNLYLNRHKFSNVETFDLQKVFEEVSKQDLNWFFKQWVYQAGYPRLKLEKLYSKKNKELSLKFTQTQKAENLQPEIFTIPFEISISNEKETKLEKVLINERTQTFKFSLDKVPNKILVDPNFKIPLKNISQNKLKIKK